MPKLYEFIIVFTGGIFFSKALQKFYEYVLRILKNFVYAFLTPEKNNILLKETKEIFAVFSFRNHFN